MSKIKTSQQIRKVADTLHRQGKRVVTVNGSFDLLHAGHVRMLREARAQGDALIVGLNSDKSVRGWKRHIGYKDWKKRPLVPQQYRAEMLAALEMVDYVTLFDELIPIEFVKSVKPDVHVNGAEYGKDCIEAKAVKTCGGVVYIPKVHQGLRTSALIKRIVDLYKNES